MSLLTATDAVAQSDVDPASQLLINQPQRQSAELQQVDDETADQEHIADEEVAHELGLQHLHEAHASGKTQTTTKNVRTEASSVISQPTPRPVAQT